MADFRDEFQHEFEHIEAQLREANDEINRRSGRPLVSAILTGLVLGGIAIAGILIEEIFWVFGTIIISLAAFELATALRDAGRRVPRVPLVVLTIAIIAASFWLGDWWHWIAFLSSCALLMLWRLVESVASHLRGPVRRIAADIGSGWFVLGYVSFLASFITLLVAKDGGQWWVLGFLIVVVLVDTAAYAVGLTLGRHPMAPKVSPKKSWEGFAGGTVVALGAGIVVSLLLLGQPWWFGLIFGAVILATATIGDLSESIIKRALGVKDMSSWLPGHGGFLDRIDGIILSGAAAYVLYLVVH